MRAHLMTVLQLLAVSQQSQQHFGLDRSDMNQSLLHTKGKDKDNKGSTS